jgi:hypothetical protein
MQQRSRLTVIALAIAVLAHGAAAFAGEDQKGDDDASRDRAGFIKGTGRVEPHARYRNDVAYEFGTVSQRGNKQIPYVERCYWTARPGIFILPTEIKQVCTRYTLENTPE